MATVLYLDVDDEITSAASRMRSSEEGRVALVVPYGSRLATSRINFRLLAREAQSRSRRLDIVAADGATRALAASAGLPVFASVTEYEAALLQRPPEEPPAAAPAGPAKATTAEPGPAAGAPTAPGSVDATPPAGRRAEEETAVLADPPPAGRLPAAGASTIPTATAGAAAAPRADRSGSLSTAPRRRSSVRRLVAIVAVVLVAVSLIAGGTAAYLYLPSATITLTPRIEPVGPLDFVVRADPEVSAPDSAAGVVPAQRLTFEIEASDTFPATGRRVEEIPAGGRVTFSNLNTGASKSIPAGAIVSTEGGIQFRTTASVQLPPAQIILGEPIRIEPSRRSVDVAAVRPGTAGNVPANAITVVPAGENPSLTKVNNPAATSGGARREFPRVTQADVNAALAQLTGRVEEEFADQLEDPARIPPGVTIFTETQRLGDPVPTVEPAGLVDQEVASFELGLSASGSVIGVDSAPVAAIAEARILQRIGVDHQLVDGSVEVTVGDPTVEGDGVDFPVRVRAERARILDPDRLLAEIKGRTIPQARAALEPFGRVGIDVWPDWVTAIPTRDDRISLDVRLPERGPDPSPGPSPRPSTTP